MTNTIEGGTFIAPGADPAHVITTLPDENAMVVTLEGMVNGGLALFNPNSPSGLGISPILCQIHLLSAVDHPHGAWVSVPGGGNGGGILVWASPMSDRVGFTNLPSTCTGSVAERVIVASPGRYPFHAAAQSSATVGAKAYISNLLSGTISVHDVNTGNFLRSITLPPCSQCRFMGSQTAQTPFQGTQMPVPVQMPFSPNNTRALVTMAKASHVALIDATTDTVLDEVECGSGCHGANWGPKKGGGFYAWVSMTYQDKLTIIDDSGVKAGDVALNTRSLLTLQGLTPMGQPTALSVAEGVGGGMGVTPFPLPPPWHLGIHVVN
jgi:DNA-binding beta-propeller fold protein YncE